MPMLGDHEKSRLQRIFEWSYRGIGIPDTQRWRDIDYTVEDVHIATKPMRRSIGKQKRWLDILAKEVVKREAMLKSMRRKEDDYLSREKIKIEIQERLRQMKEIQNSIARQERMDTQRKFEEALVDSSKCCQATYNAQMDRLKKEERVNDISSNSKHLLEHNLNTSKRSVNNYYRSKQLYSEGGLGQTRENYQHHDDKQPGGGIRTLKHHQMKC